MRSLRASWLIAHAETVGFRSAFTSSAAVLSPAFRSSRASVSRAAVNLSSGSR
jgi:hypothetical protein